MKKLFYNQKWWMLALCLPFLFQLSAMAQPNCQLGIYAQSSPANVLTYNFQAYPLFDSTCFSGNSVFTWTFGDNSTGTGSSVTHTYNQPGTYIVCVTATTTFGFTVAQCDTVIVGSALNCQATFTLTNNNGTVTTTPILSGPGGCFNVNTIFTWSWGDGSPNSTSGLNQNATHYYATAGTYTICLSAFTPGVAPTTFCSSVTVNPNLPVVGIYGQVLAGGACNPQTTNVRLIAINGPEEYSMTIGNAPDSCFYWFQVPSTLQRAWVIRAEPQPNTEYLPTYLGDVLYYTEATIFTTPSATQFNPPINLVPFFDSLPFDSLAPGLGTITGNILGAGTVVTSMLNGYNVTATFQPQNAQVILLNAAGQPVAIATVNANGTFSIPGLPQGQYSLRVECPKVPSQPIAFELTEGNMNRNFQFSANGTGINVVTSYKKNLEKQLASVVPNPAQSEISLFGFSGQVYVIDAQGRTVMQTTQHRNISIEHLPAGLYTLKGQTNEGKVISTRLVKN